MTMDARKQRVLQAIVALYGLEGEPVGAKLLCPPRPGRGHRAHVVGL